MMCPFARGRWYKPIILAPVVLGFAFRTLGFDLPTANRALFEPGGQPEFFVGTVGKPWTSGTFGFVRSEGTQFHEGLDIRSLSRDRGGEPVDPVKSTANGSVAYLNTRAGLSNYGKYIVIRHEVDGLEIYSLYAHLREVRPGLHIGAPVRAGEQIGVLGRTANTRQGISRERAHLHFELNFLVNDRFKEWYAARFPGQRNDHGNWNGQNLLGIDPAEVLTLAQRQGTNFNLRTHLQSLPVLCRVLVRKTSFPWVRRYSVLSKRNPLVEKEGIAGYELAIGINGVVVEFIPRAPSEFTLKANVQLVSVNEQEQRKNSAQKLVTRSGSGWRLTSQGLDLVNLITY